MIIEVNANGAISHRTVTIPASATSAERPMDLPERAGLRVAPDGDSYTVPEPRRTF